MTYHIEIVPTCNHPRFRYQSSVHPQIGDYVYVRDDRYKVVAVGHLITTKVGTHSESHHFDYVEVKVMKV